MPNRQKFHRKSFAPKRSRKTGLPAHMQQPAVSPTSDVELCGEDAVCRRRRILLATEQGDEARGGEIRDGKRRRKLVGRGGRQMASE